MAYISCLRVGQAFLNARSEKRDAALDAIYMACTETKIYLTEFRKNGSRDAEKEKSLASLWKKASIPVRNFDKELADKCYYKGEYWINPEEWHGVDEDLNISIERVIEEARNLKVLSDEEYEKRRSELGRNG